MLSSDSVKGLKNKATVATKKSYGFREYQVLKMALFHQLRELTGSVLTNKPQCSIGVDSAREL